MQGVFWSTYKYFSIPVNKGDKNYGAKNRDFFFFFFTENMVFLKFPFRIIKIFELHCKINGENANKCFDHMK